MALVKQTAPNSEEEAAVVKRRIFPPAKNIRARREGDKTLVDHHQMDLARVRAELRLASCIVQTTEKPRVPHTPYVWNHLKPYASTFDPEFVQDLPDDVFVGGRSRMTVQNLVDPEVDVRIDQAKVVLPEINLTRGQLLTRMRHERALVPSQSDGIFNPKTKPLPWSEKKGSTRLTPFNKVQHARPEIARRKGIIDFTDVSQLRRQMSTLYYGRMKKKDDDDFVRTSQDFYRMDLNVARNRAHPMNRYLFDQACRLYLGPSRGSIRAYAKATRRHAIAEGEE